MILGNLNIYMLALLFVFNAILLTININMVVESTNTKISSKYFIYSLILFLLSLIPLQILAELGTGRIYMAKFLVNIPVYVLLVYYLIILSIEIIFAKKFMEKSKTIIGNNSIKDSMDNLPDGICFSKYDGTPLLVNRMMQDISYAVFGNMLANDIACAEDIRNNNIKKDAEILERNPLVIKTMGDIWQIKIVDHKKVRETLAYKITLEWALYQEIEEKNRQIEKINASLKEYQKNVAEYTRNKEILQAKIKIHDKIGQCLIYFKRYLDMEDKTKEDRDKLINLWKESLLMFEGNSDNVNDDVDSSNNEAKFDKLISTAKDIGVSVDVKGKIPTEEGDLQLLVKIVHEALNNAIRHAKSENILIELNEDKLNIHCKISNDGTFVKKPIIEKGGLKNIRQSIENCGGKMEINLDSNFTLILSWPKGVNYDL